MIENRAVGTNDDIQWRKHVPWGEKVKKNLFFSLFFCVEKLIIIYRVGRINRVGRVTPIKPFFLGLTLTHKKLWHNFFLQG